MFKNTTTMASEDEAITKLKAWRTSDHRNGTDTELLTIPTTTTAASRPTKLFVLCGDRFESSKAFRSGNFSVRIIRLSGSPISMVTCMVGDHQWMLAKDSMTIRVGDRSFVFSLPGVLYGLALPEGRLEDQCKVLEEIFASFCAYHDLVGLDGTKLANPRPESDNWASAHSKILNLATRTNTKIAATIVNPAKPLSSEKIQRAVRMSAAVKLLSRALLSGNLIPDRHLHVSINAVGFVHAYPTMWMVVDILDTIQAGKPLGRGGRRASMQGFWGFKVEGLATLLDVVKAYEAFATGRKRRRVEEAGEEGKRREVGVPGSSICGGGGGVVDLVVEEVEKRVGSCGTS